MPIVSGDLLFKLSTTGGSSGNSTAGTTSGSLGKYISTTQISSTPLNNLFDDITGDNNANSVVDYRCIFVHNANASGLTLQNSVMWLSSEVAGGASISIAVDLTGATAIGSATAQAQQTASVTGAPTGLTFTAPTVKASGINIGNVGAGSGRAVWVRRTAANTAAVNNDGVVLRIEGDTAA